MILSIHTRQYRLQLSTIFFILIGIAAVFPSEAQTKSLNADYISAKEGKVAVTGGNIWYKIQGNSQGVPLLFIHGGPGGSSCSFTQLNELGKTRPIIFYDQLGAGKSDHATNPKLWTPSRFAEELHLLLQKLNYPKVNLIAHSWGAAVAASYLQTYGQDKIASVIFSGPYLSSADWTQGTRALRKNLSLKSQAVFEKYERENLAPTAEYQAAEQEFYSRYLFHSPPKNSSDCDENSWNQSIYEIMWGDSEFKVIGSLKNFDATPVLAQLKIPTLFLIGEYDESAAFIVQKYQQTTPHSKMVVLKNAAHMSMIDQPQDFMAAINHFLEAIH